MTSREKHDIPGWALGAGEAIQSYDNRALFEGFIKFFVKSSSPAYRYAHWETAEQVLTPDGLETALPPSKANPSASLLTVIPRFKTKATVMASRINEYDSIVSLDEAVPAVAYTYKGRTHAAMLPHGMADLSRLEVSGNYYAALRSGRTDYQAGLGAWHENERVFIQPYDAGNVDNVPIAELTARFPGAALL
jgi:hypothetical protein